MPRPTHPAMPPGRKPTARPGRGGRTLVVAFAALALLALAVWKLPIGGRTLVSRWTEEADVAVQREPAAPMERRASMPTPGSTELVRAPAPVRPARMPTEDIRAEDRAAVDALMR